MSNELAVLPPTITPAVVYQTKGGIDDVIAKIKAEVSTLDPDVSTEAGRAEIRAMAYKVTRSKTLLDDMGKKLGEEWRLSIEKVNADRRRLRGELEILALAVRRPLTEYEDAEQRRIDAHERAIQHIASFGERVSAAFKSAALEAQYQEFQALYINRDWQEFAKRAADARALAASRLLDAYKGAVDRENAQAEADRQRQQAEEEARLAREKAQQEREERLRAEAAEEARQKAEAEALAREQAAKRAWAEREARIRAEAAKAEQAKKDAEATREKAERDAEARAAALEAAKKTAEEWRLKSEAQWAEAERRAAEAQQKTDEGMRRIEERDRREAAVKLAEENAVKRAVTAGNKLRVQEAAIVALTENGLSRNAAAHAIALIAEGKVPGVVMQYEIRDLAR